MTKKIFKSIGLIALAIAVAIGSFFVPISKNDTSFLASANETTFNSVVFTSSDLFYCRLGNKDTTTVSSSNINNFSSLLSSSSGTTQSSSMFNQVRFNFRITLDNSDIFDFEIIGRANSGAGTHSSSTNFEASYVPVGSFARSMVNDGIPHYASSNCYYGNTNGGAHMSFTRFGIMVLGNLLTPTLEMVSVEIGNYGTFENFNFPGVNDLTFSSFNSNYSNSNIIVYTDSAGWKYCYFIPVWTSYPDTEAYLSYRKYYTPAYDFFTDNQIYQEGYNNGLNDNQENIYNNGYNTGFDDGFEDGKITGVVEANDYSFFSLFGAIFDAPVTLFTSLLNFNFLGINLWSFITSLLTLAIILFVVKLFIRR